jgi:hypothetical protein
LTEYLSFIEPLVLIVVGAVIGFLSSIGFDSWKEHLNKTEMVNRIIDELEIIRQEITNNLKNKIFSTRELKDFYSQDAYEAFKQDIIRKLNGKKFRAIQDTYLAINSLKEELSDGQGKQQYINENINRCNIVLAKIDSTIKLLG